MIDRRRVIVKPPPGFKEKMKALRAGSMEAFTTAADRCMTQAEQAIAAEQATPPPDWGTGPAFRRRAGITIKLETPPNRPTFGVMRLIKGGKYHEPRNEAL